MQVVLVSMGRAHIEDSQQWPSILSVQRGKSGRTFSLMMKLRDVNDGNVPYWYHPSVLQK